MDDNLYPDHADSGEYDGGHGHHAHGGAGYPPHQGGGGGGYPYPAPRGYDYHSGGPPGGGYGGGYGVEQGQGYYPQEGAWAYDRGGRRGGGRDSGSYGRSSYAPYPPPPHQQQYGSPHSQQRHRGSYQPRQSGGGRDRDAGAGREIEVDPLQRQVKTLLVPLGEPDDFHAPSELFRVAGVVEGLMESEKGKAAVARMFRIIAVEQPHKIPLTAALVGFLVLSPPQTKRAPAAAETDADGDTKLNGNGAAASSAPSAGAVIVQELVKAFRSHLDNRLWRNTRLSLCLFASLVSISVIRASSLRKTLSAFTAVFDEPGVSAVRGDRAAVCIITALCFGGEALLGTDGDADDDAKATQAREEVDELVNAVVRYAESRRVETDLVRPFTSPPSDAKEEDHLLHEESFDTHVAALQELKARAYRRSSFLPTPRDLLPPALAARIGTLDAPSAVSIPEVLVPPDEDQEMYAPAIGDDAAPEAPALTGGKRAAAAAAMVAAGKGREWKRAGTGVDRVGSYGRWFKETVPAPGMPESVVLHMIVDDTIDLLQINRKEGAKLLLALPKWFRRGTFGGRVEPTVGIFGDEAEGTAWTTGEEGDKKGDWALEDILVERILSTTLLLPLSPHKPLYYSSLLREIITLSPQTVAPPLGKTVRRLYNGMLVGRVGAETVRRFAEWFSVHLSNFNFGWNWKEWVGDMALPAAQPRRAFIRRVVELEMRLAYHERIKGTLPEPIQENAMPLEEPAAVYTYANKDNAYHSAATTILDSIKSKSSSVQMLTVLESFKREILEEDDSAADIPMEEDDDATRTGKVKTAAEADVVVRDVLTQTMLSVGSRSFSHFLNVVERYHSVLRQLSTSAGGRAAMLGATLRFWTRSPQWVLIVLDKLLQYRIVEPVDVVDVVFSPAALETVPRWVCKGSGDDEDVVPASQSLSHLRTGVIRRDWSGFTWWELIRTAIDKVNGRVDQVRKRLEELETSEAVERERREAQEAAQKEDEEAAALASRKDEAEAAVLFPTTANLPTRPEAAAKETREADKKLSADEARTQLEAIRTEQRKVLVGTTRGFVEVLALSGALEAPPVSNEDATVKSDDDWQAWWVAQWYREYVRSFSKTLSTHREVILANVFVGAHAEGLARELFERACDMATE